MAQNTNLNIAPYFDDFDKNKGFLKVLFKPGFPVQARELTTLQTLLQDQIDTFGQGVYKEGSMVVPGGITLNKKVPCILIQNNYLNLDVENYRTALDGKIIKGSTSGVRARILFSVSATTSTRGNISFYLNYLQKAEDNVTSTFSVGETFVCEDDITYLSTTIASGTPLAQLLNSDALAVGSTASVGQGVFFARGYFVNVAEQTIILDQYGTDPSYKVGLKVEERIVTADEDATLYDNAIGSTNFSAPGADRFKITLTLVKKLLTAPNSADFIELLRTNTGKIEKKVERSDLGFINDVLATRTKEESGNYYVKKFEIDARENLDDGFNNGVYKTGEVTQDGGTPSEANVAIQLSSGCAYVQGYRTERIAATYKDVDKPRTFDSEMNRTVTSDFGSFVLMNNLYEAPRLYETITLRDQPTASGSGGTLAGDSVGVARVANFAYESGPLTAGSADTVFRANLIDVDFLQKLTMNASVAGSPSVGDRMIGQTSGATAYEASDSGSDLFVNGVNGTFIVGETVKNALGTTIGVISSIKRYNFGDVKQYGFSTGGGTADAVLDVKVALPGSGPIMSGAGGGTSGTITATLSNFKSQLRIGDIVEFSNNGAAHKARVTAVTNNFSFNVTRLGSTTIGNGALTSPIVRTRPEMKDGEKRTLLTPLGYSAIKNTNNNGNINPSGRFRTSVSATVASGNATAVAGAGLKWVNGGDNDDFLVIITSGSGAGQIVQTPTITNTATNADSIQMSGLCGGGSGTIDVVGTVTSADRSGKQKTTERMKVLLVSGSTGTSNGLSQVTAGHGTRVEDDVISLGCADVFKVKAVLESTNSATPEIPNFEYTNLLGDVEEDDVITGETSGSRARVVSKTSNIIYFIPIEDDRFTAGENITAPNATLKIKSTINLGSTDITDNFDLDNGQRDQFYDYSRLIRKPGVANPTHKLLIIFDRFFTSDGINGYTVDSYAAEDYNIIPDYSGTPLRDVIDFRPIVPQQLASSGTQSSPFTLSATSYFNIGARAFTNNEVGLPGISDTTTLSLQYYLPRIDKVFLDKDSIISVVKGAPSTRPQAPEDLEDAMLLGTVTYAPYVFDVDADITIEETNYRRYTFRDIQQLEDRIKTLEFYTQLSLLEGETANMEIRDSSGLNRFKNGFIVDNFGSLSTADTLHPDYRVSTDFERGQMRPAHYTTQVPLQYSTSSQNVQQNDDEIITLPYSSVVLVDQPYASAVENVNPFNVFTFSGDIELFPESDNWVDTKSLNPIKGPVVEGNFMTTVREYNADQNGFSPIHWNSWKTTWTGTDINTSVGAWRDAGGGGKGRRNQQRRTITTTTTTTTRQSRTGIRYRVTPVIEQQSLGSKLVSVEHIQFMRSRNISFTCQKLKPRTKFYAFFDNIAVPTRLITPKVMGVVKDPSTDAKTNNIPFQIGETVYVKKGNGKFRFKARVSAPNENIQINPIDGTDISTTTDYTSNLTFINVDTKSLADKVKGSYYGSPKINDYLVGETSGAVAKVSNKDLITDKRGNLRGSFFIDAPNVEGNQKFKTGTKLFRLTDSSTNSQVSGVSDSNGEAEFTASGILQTTQETIISVRNAKITSEAQYDARTLTSVGRTRRDETRPTPPPPPPPETDWDDPLAQTFLIEDATLEGGVFLTKIDIFFYTKDPEIPVMLDIRTVENGYPTQNIFPFSKVVKQSEDVFTSDDASKPTTFEFKAPVYIPLKQECAMVLTSDSNQYKVFISLLGNDAIDAAHIGEKISEQPYIGVLFKSQNASTWTASQYEDLMFKIYRAQFTLPSTSAPSRLILENGELAEENGGFLNLRRNAIKTTAASDTMRIFHSNHGMQSTLNYLQLSGVISEVADAQIPVDGSDLTSTAGSVVVDDAVDLFHQTIGGSAVSNSNPGFIRILGVEEDGSGDEIIAYQSIDTGSNTINFATNGRNHNGTSGSSTGKTHLKGAIVQCYNFDGIPLTKINKTHSSGLASINSPHSYTLQISGVPAGSGIQGGGANIVASQNVPWDVLTPQIQSQVEPGTSIVARVQGTSGTSCGPFPAGFNAETSFVKDSDFQEITIGEENYFPATKIVANQLNEINRMNSVKSLTVELNMFSEVSHLSPVVDLTRCDVITTANVINNIEPGANVGSETAGNYITKVARLEKSATGLKLMMAANTWTQSKVVVMYKLIPVGYSDSLDELPFEFFNTTGIPDTGATIPNNDLTTFTDYEYTVEDTDEFDGFQVKISLLNHNQPYIPRVRDLRVIALA